MKIYAVRHRVSFGRAGSVEAEPSMDNGFDVLDQTYARGDLKEASGVDPNYLKYVLNAKDNQQCIAMVFNEAEMINTTLGGREVDPEFTQYLRKLDKKSLIILQPYGSLYDRSKRNVRHLMDLALSGHEFPQTERAFDIDVAFFGKANDKQNYAKLYISPVRFPENLGDHLACDEYFYANINRAARMLIESARFSDDENKERLIGEYKSDPKGMLIWIRDYVCEDDKDPATLIFALKNDALLKNLFGSLWAQKFLSR